MRLYTPEEAAEFLRVTPRTVREWLRTGRLKGVKAGRLWRVPEDELKAIAGVGSSGAPKRIKVIFEWDDEERVWLTHVPALNWISSFGETKEEALAMTREAIELYLEVSREKGAPVAVSDVDVSEIEVTL